MPHLHQILVSHLVGGAGIVAIHLASAAPRHGFACTGWVPGPGPASAALTSERVRWRSYDLTAMLRGTVAHQIACARMVPGLIGTRRPIVHVHNPVVYRLLWPALAAVRARIVVHFQIEPSNDEIDWAMRFPPDHVIACARYIAAQIDRRLPATRRRPAVSAIPNAVDTDRFTPGPREVARQQVGLRTQRFVLLMMANLARHKGQSTAIRAVDELVRRGVPVECWLAGEDRSPGREYERELRELVAQLNLSEHVRFLGFRSDAPELLRAADLLLLPSSHEGLPLTILEAQAAGTPVIGSTIPGILEVIENDATGLIVPADDYLGYADAVQRLYERPDVRDRLRKAAAANVRDNYAWSQLERRTYAIYQSLATGSGGLSGDDPAAASTGAAVDRPDRLE